MVNFDKFSFENTVVFCENDHFSPKFMVEIQMFMGDIRICIYGEKHVAVFLRGSKSTAQ